MASISKLRDEITNDPLDRGYAGMTDQQVYDDLHTAYVVKNKPLMTADEILQAVVFSEFLVMATDAQKEERFWNLMSMEQLNPFGVEAQMMTNIFGAGSQTISQLASMRTQNITRVQDLGLGAVRIGNIAAARV